MTDGEKQIVKCLREGACVHANRLFDLTKAVNALLDCYTDYPQITGEPRRIWLKGTEEFRKAYDELRTMLDVQAIEKQNPTPDVTWGPITVGKPTVVFVSDNLQPSLARRVVEQIDRCMIEKNCWCPACGHSGPVAEIGCHNGDCAISELILLGMDEDDENPNGEVPGA